MRQIIKTPYEMNDFFAIFTMSFGEGYSCNIFYNKNGSTLTDTEGFYTENFTGLIIEKVWSECEQWIQEHIEGYRDFRFKQ